MNHPTNAFAVLAAALVVTAASVGAVVAPGAAASPTDAESATDATFDAAGTVDGVALQSSLADLTGLIERIDAILESVVDLLRTLNELFRLVGAGEAED